MKLAFFGGSFDPIHTGHDTIVKTALEILDIDKLIIMPTYINPFKSEFCAPPKLRLKWVEQIWGSLDKVEISTFEIDQNRPVPTIQSVRNLYEKYNIEKFYLIIGADHLHTLHMWDEFEELQKLVSFIIASRDEIEIPKNLQNLDINVNISSSFIRENLNQNEIPNLIKNDVIKFYQGLKMQKRVEKIAEILSNKKAENVEIIDMSDKEYIAKFVIIATTLTGKHAFSLIDDLKENLKPLGEQFLNIESSDDWSVADLGDIIIHLMSETYRAKYNIEEFLEKLKKDEY